MHLEKQFDVKRSRQEAADIIRQNETLVGLFPDSDTEIVADEGQRKTTRTRYTALGREGTATFHFDFAPDGDIAFEKVCDGNVWKRLSGKLSLRERGDSTRVRLQMEGKTKGLVPEFTIKGAMRDQLDEMAKALQQQLERS
ncbi:MAG: hypothetical protein AAF430_13505 [Myxococcota bacterium]